MLLHRLSEDTHIEPTIMMIYGGAGSGKTWFSGSAPRAVVFSDRNGIVTLKSKGWKEAHPGIDPYLIELIPDDDPAKPNAFDSIRNQLEELFNKDNIDKFDTIVIDDIDFTRLAARNKGIVLNGLLNRSKTSTNATQKGSPFKDIYILTMSDFGTEMNLFDTFLIELTSACRQYRKNLIVCAHERYYTRKDDKGNEYTVSVKPLFTGKDTPDNVTRYFDILWYVHTTGAGTALKREFITDQESYYPCKTRWSKLFSNPEKNITAAQVFDRIIAYQQTQLPSSTTPAESTS